ncbi:uncharacterized protein LOC134234192 [Saccostrea cucullata]|uniref:uncharacterized protein LOC134234192 n=1 Tax=Saccostrea cuccullata TaxID=36930 RepID=UPI002ED4A079
MSLITLREITSSQTSSMVLGRDDNVKVQVWESEWLMSFNPEKCEVIRITNKRQAFTNVITNDKHEKRRRENGKTDLHRQQSKQSKRKHSVKTGKKKEGRGTSYLDKSWTPTSKKNLTACLWLDIISPEKTDDEDSTKRVRLPFSWGSTRLCKGKEALDKAYRHKVLKTESARRQLVFVKDGREDTTTPPPEKCAAWAISRDYSS